MMKTLSLTSASRSALLALAIFGFLVPNGVFLWVFFTRFTDVTAAMSNPIACVFILEAFALMFLFAWLIFRQGRKQEALIFILLSLIGSLLFSVPGWLWWHSRTTDASALPHKRGHPP